MSQSRLWADLRVVPLVLLLLGGGCKGEKPAAPTTAASPATPAPAAAAGAPALPEVDDSKLPLPLQMKLAAARREAQRNPESDVHAMELGALAFVHGFPELAVVCIARAAQLDPNDSNWLYCQALAQQQAGKTAEAQATFEKFAALRPEYPQVRVRLLALRCERDPAGTSAELQGLLEREPNNPVWHTALGMCAQAGGRPERALESYRAALTHAPRYGPAHAGLARALAALGRNDEAGEHARLAGADTRLRPQLDPIELALRQQGLDPVVLRDSAERWAAQQKFDRAEQLLRSGLEVNQDDPELRVLLGDVLARQGRPDEAIEELQRVLRRAGLEDHAGAKVSLAFAYSLKDNFTAAEQLLQEVLARDPADMPALRRLVDVSTRQNAPEKALKPIEAALASGPTNATLQVDAAELLHRVGQPERERAALLRAIELQPDSARARYALGVLEYTQGHRDEARRAWEAALKLDPRSLEIRHGLIALLTEARDFPGLERALREGLKELPDSPDLQNRLAWLLATCVDAKLRNPDEAVQWAEKAANTTRHLDHVILDTLAAAYAAQGRFEDASKWATEAVRMAQAAGDAAATKEYRARLGRYQQQEPPFQP